MLCGRSPFVLLLIPSALSLPAQHDSVPRPPLATPDSVVIELGAIEERPSFPGGETELMRYLTSHAHFPDSAAEAGVGGKVLVQFVVEKDGSIADVKVKRGVHPALDAEALRLVRSMPAWTPGTLGGTPVRVQYVIPIGFELK